MKRIVILWIGALFASVSSAQAQKDVTQFLGIPVDGYKPDMIRKLENKGYTISPFNKDVLVGEFNGSEVNIQIGTNNNKVYRIMVGDVDPMNEAGIKIRFNELCQQFKKNMKYVPASLSKSDFTIPADEDISYGMSVENKRYEAVFFQLPAELASAALIKERQGVLSKKYTEEQVSNPTKEGQRDIYMLDMLDMLGRYSKKFVWFMITEFYGKYYITMYYDNEYNRANGEDL